jgi:MFS family permease
MAQSVRNDILNDWGTSFGFTQGELGTISGMGLMGFGLTIIFFSFFADLLGYGPLMVIAFLLHFGAVVTTLAAPFAFNSAAGKPGAYWCLYIGQFLFSLGNGTCEAVINPMTATMFPKNRTHWLNILHAGWPAGLVVGSVIALLFNQIDALSGWTVKWGIVVLPVLIYGVLMVGRRFPRSEAKTAGVKPQEMMAQLGMLGTAIAAFLIGLWLSTSVFPGIGVPGWLGWGPALLLWLAFSWGTGFTIGHWMLAFLILIHGLVGWVELGTDSWIVNIGKIVLISDNWALAAFIWTNLLMTALRFFAGPIVHKISPIGLLFCSAVIGTTGLVLLGLPATDTVWLWFAAVTVYGIGKTFYWPTMLGVISERFPRGGALALGFSGGVGMLMAGIVGNQIIGYQQDFAARQELTKAPATYDRYKSGDVTSPFPFLPALAGLDNGKVGVLDDYMGLRQQGKTPTYEDLKIWRDFELAPNSEELKKRLEWWKSEGRPFAEKDFDPIRDARLVGGKTTLTWTAAIPAIMALCYLFLLVYFKLAGGYKAEVLVGHAAEDEEFTGGTEGPGEG